MKLTVLVVGLFVLVLSIVGCAPKGVPVDHDPRMDLPAVERFIPNQANQDVATIVLGAVAALGFILAFRHWIKTGSPAVVCMMLGGMMNTLIEPVCDLLAALMWTRADHMTIQLFGRPLPLYLTFMYMAGYGTAGLFVYLKLLKGATRKQFLNMALCMAVICVALELPILNMDGTYDYYGSHQPLEFFQYPFWMVGINSFGIMLGASMIYLFTPHLKGWQWLITIPLMPFITLMFAYSACAYPAFIAINHQFPPIVDHLLGIASIALCFMMGWVLTFFVCKDAPYEVVLRKRDA